jgi:para-nitrobenzyl esterase
VRAYQFAWAPPHSRFKACHCIELPFMFGTSDAWPGAGMLAGGDAGEMAALSALMRRAWIGFVRTGDPAAGGLPWPAYHPTGRKTMLFDRVCGAVADPAGLGAQP